MKNKLFTMYAYSATLGGETTVINTLTRALKQRGWDVDLVTRLTTAYEYPTLLSDDGPNLVRIKRPLTLHLANYIRKNKPDVIMSFDEIPNFEAIVARMLAGISNRLIIRYDCPLYTPYYPVKFTHRFGVRTKARRFMLRHFFMDKANAIIAVSDGVANSIKQTYPNIRSPVYRLYNPLDINHINRMASANKYLHPWFDSNTPVIVSVCRLDPEKDLPTMFDAFALAVKQRPLKLIVVGAGVLDNYLKEYSSGLGLDDSVYFTGYVENQYPYISNASVFAMSSYAEGLGCSLQEALICGTTIVTTDYDYGAKELLCDGEYGTLVPVKDVQSMAEAFLYAVDHKQDPLKLYERAKDFDIDSHIEELLNIVEG